MSETQHVVAVDSALRWHLLAAAAAAAHQAQHGAIAHLCAVVAASADASDGQCSKAGQTLYVPACGKESESSNTRIDAAQKAPWSCDIHLTRQLGYLSYAVDLLHNRL